VKYGLSQQEAADVFQATCTELLVRLPELREPRALPKWLMQVAHHESYRWKRHNQRVVSREGRMIFRACHSCHRRKSRSADAGRANVREAMALLTPQCRRLVELLFFETPSRPYAEVAANLASLSALSGFTRQKCLERLRRQLEELDSSDARNAQEKINRHC